jgi:hypothetical protein
MQLSSLVSGPSSIGRYFDVVTLIPASVFVTYMWLLIEVRPWTGTPHWREALTSLASMGLGGAGVLALASLIAGLVLHPLQFGMTQLLEGYWGATDMGRRCMTKRVVHHRRRMTRLEDLRSDGKQVLIGFRPGDILPEYAVPAQVQVLESDRLLANYPNDKADVMPTRLGNVLRRYESGAGRQYGLPMMVVAPHLALVCRPEHVAVLESQRTDMDLAIRLCWLSMIASLCTGLLFWRTGWWLAIAAIPYGAAYLFYRGSLILDPPLIMVA